MPQAEKKVACPACAHEFGVQPDADLAHLVCPYCEAEIPEQAVRGLSEVAEDLALGFKPGHRLGNYVIEALLGSGGMAVVFRGRQLSLNRSVAIKILPKDLAKNKLFIQRFTSEAAVLANLNHPNVVSVIDRGREGEIYFIVMEYVEGETLKDRLKREKKLAPDQILQIGEQVLAGLEYAHRRGVVHRDIKPGNIMINKEEMVKIADFGLAHLAKAQGGLDVTRDNQTMGTLKYMAPEQLTSAKNIDGRTDLYSFGVCLYEFLTGKLPLGMFKMPSEMESSLDVRWDEIILRSLRMDASERYATADEMARALRELATTPRITQAQREKEEDAAAKSAAAGGGLGVRGVLSLTACASCSHESAPTAHQCEQCGAGLDDIFDECPNCKIENRVDVAQCPGCGMDLALHRDKLRKSAEAIQAKAVQFAGDRQFDLALQQLKKLSRFRTREYAAMRESARVWIERVSHRRERFFQQTYEAGQRMEAEGRTERALEIWSSLPDNYEDIAVRRRELTARDDAANVAVAEGNRFYDQGDVAHAVAEWEKAAACRPRDAELNQRLAAARIQLGNLNIKRTYLRESKEEAARGNFSEALILCRKVLELDPNDESAILVAKGLEAKEHEVAESEIREAPKVKKLSKVKPAAPLAERLHLWPIFLGLILLAVIGLALWFFCVFLPGARTANVAEARKAFEKAQDLKDKGNILDAISQCSRVAKDYADTTYAEQANQLSLEMQKLNADAHARCEEAATIAGKGDLDSLIAGYKKFKEIISVPPVALVNDYRDMAAHRLEEIRANIAKDEAELAAKDEKNGDWHQALQKYLLAAQTYEVHTESFQSKIARAQKQLDDCAAQVQAGQAAVHASNWDVAYHAAVAALDLVPSDPDARSLLAGLAPKLQPPPGMVLVPPGKYVVGGGEDNPRRTVELPFGLFIDSKEVTRGRFAEYLNATKQSMPPGWAEQLKGNAELPVANVTWAEAATFAAWAGCALPTEEQWECACRGTSGQLYPWGDAWSPASAVLGFGPVPPGSVPADRSHCGCVDMAGNVSEWTATALEPEAPGPKVVFGVPHPKTRLYIVKGSSWAGVEKERPTCVIAMPLSAGAVKTPRFLTPDPNLPELKVLYRTSMELEYLGVAGAGDVAFVLVRKWMPGWDQWAEAKFQVMPEQEIGGMASVTVEQGPKPRRKTTLDLTTGCFAVKYEAKTWMDVRDPSGVTRRLLLGKEGASPPPKPNDCKEPPPATEMTLEQAVSAATRMAGREDGRYINVGFRCAKTLWPVMVPAAPEEPKAPPKQSPSDYTPD